MKRKKKSLAVITSMGGKARAKALSGKRRSEIARKAARARWDKEATKVGPVLRWDAAIDRWVAP